MLVPLRQKIVAEALTQYNAMNLSPFELVGRKRAELEARERLIEATRDYWTALSDVDAMRAGGQPAGGSSGGSAASASTPAGTTATTGDRH